MAMFTGTPCILYPGQCLLEPPVYLISIYKSFRRLCTQHTPFRAGNLKEFSFLGPMLSVDFYLRNQKTKQECKEKIIISKQKY